MLNLAPVAFPVFGADFFEATVGSDDHRPRPQPSSQVDHRYALVSHFGGCVGWKKSDRYGLFNSLPPPPLFFNADDTASAYDGRAFELSFSGPDERDAWAEDLRLYLDRDYVPDLFRSH